MKWNELYNYYKNKYNDYLILYKMGNFYNVIGKDIYIMKYLFNYSIINNNGINKIGFPISSLNKVINKFNELKINYLVIEKNDGIVKVSYKKRFKENNYNSYENNSNIFNYKKNKINNIINILNNKLEDEKFDITIGKLEEILNEGLTFNNN